MNTPQLVTIVVLLLSVDAYFVRGASSHNADVALRWLNQQRETFRQNFHQPSDDVELKESLNEKARVFADRLAQDPQAPFLGPSFITPLVCEGIQGESIQHVFRTCPLENKEALLVDARFRYLGYACKGGVHVLLLAERTDRDWAPEVSVARHTLYRTHSGNSGLRMLMALVDPERTVNLRQTDIADVLGTLYTTLPANTDSKTVFRRIKYHRYPSAQIQHSVRVSAVYRNDVEANWLVRKVIDRFVQETHFQEPEKMAYKPFGFSRERIYDQWVPQTITVQLKQEGQLVGSIQVEWEEP